MKKNRKIFIFCMIFVANSATAQEYQLKSSTVKGFTPSPSFINFHTKVHDVEKFVVPPRFYVNNLGFFCKQELKFQSATGLPFKFRLGSVQYCDRMEGKKNTGVLPAY